MGNLRYTQMKKDKKCKSEYYKKYHNNDNNCLRFGGKWRLIEIPKKIRLNIKWSIQRIKYGYCDYDVYDLDYWLSKTLASALYKLADTTHGYPPAQVAQCLSDKKKGIARDSYSNLDEEFKYPSFSEKEDDEYFEKWQDILRNMADNLAAYKDEFFDTEDYKKYEKDDKNFYKLWEEFDELKYKQAQKGLVEVSKWFGHLWD